MAVRENVILLLEMINQSDLSDDLRRNELIVELLSNIRYLAFSMFLYLVSYLIWFCFDHTVPPARRFRNVLLPPLLMRN
jgi:hypothetical protein